MLSYHVYGKHELKHEDQQAWQSSEDWDEETDVEAASILH